MSSHRLLLHEALTSPPLNQSNRARYTRVVYTYLLLSHCLPWIHEEWTSPQQMMTTRLRQPKMTHKYPHPHPFNRSQQCTRCLPLHRPKPLQSRPPRVKDQITGCGIHSGDIRSLYLRSSLVLMGPFLLHAVRVPPFVFQSYSDICSCG